MNAFKEEDEIQMGPLPTSPNCSCFKGIATDEIVEKDSMGMLSYRGLTYVVIIVMSFLLPVIVINLFIGLAVG